MRKQPARISNSPRRRRRSEPSGQFAFTAAEVARAAGVSRSVVSRAFTPGAPIAEETRAHVHKIARRLGYSPNIIARSLITRRSDLIAVVVNTLSDLRDTSFFDVLLAELQAIGKQALIVRTQGPTTSPRRCWWRRSRRSAKRIRDPSELTLSSGFRCRILRVGVSYQIAGAIVFADNVTPPMVKAISARCRRSC